MVNLEFLFQHFCDCYAGRLTNCLWLKNKVRCQTGIVSCHRPQVQVMDARDARHPSHRAADHVKVESARHALKQDMRGITKQGPGAGQHPQTNGYGDDRVDPGFTGELDRNGSRNYAQ